MDHRTFNGSATPSGHLSAENAAPTFEQNMAALDQLGAIIDKRIAEIAELRKTIRRYRAAMDFVRDELEEDFDTVDGGDGQPAPNKAMRLANELDKAIYGLGGY